jgi:hypothetical protein
MNLILRCALLRASKNGHIRNRSHPSRLAEGGSHLRMTVHHMSLGCRTALLFAIQLRANLVERRKVAPFGLYTLVCFERVVPSAA